MTDVIKIEVGRIDTNCYIVCFEGKCVIIDPGDDADVIEAIISRENLTPSFILITHGHYDHFGAAEELRNHYSIKIYAPEKDKKLFLNPALNCSLSFGERATLIPDEYITNGDIVNFGFSDFSVMSTPGHTQGSVCYLYENNIFSGDTVFFHSHGRTDLPTGNIYDIRNSFLSLMKLSPKYKIYPGHGIETTMKEELKYNDIMARINGK